MAKINSSRKSGLPGGEGVGGWGEQRASTEGEMGMGDGEERGRPSRGG